MSLGGMGKHPRLEACEVLVACDVANPLCGPDGASRVYGPQKGADAAAVERLDAALANLAAVIERDLGHEVRELPRAGAAGGLGAGLVAFLGAELQSGAEVVAEAAGLAERVAAADVVVTGEGRFDGQTAFGKTPYFVAERARRDLDAAEPLYREAMPELGDAPYLPVDIRYSSDEQPPSNCSTNMSP